MTENTVMNRKGLFPLALRNKEVKDNRNTTRNTTIHSKSRKLATDSRGTKNVKLGTSSKSWEDSMSFFHPEACGRTQKRTPLGELRLN